MSLQATTESLKWWRLTGQALAIFFCYAAALPSPTAASYILSTGEWIECKVKTDVGEYSVPEQVGYAHGFSGFTDFDSNGLPFFIFDRSRLPHKIVASVWP
jgi:hypothetical protein